MSPAPGQRDRGQMTAKLHLHVGTRHVGREAARDQRQILIERDLDPLVLAGGLRIVQGHAIAGLRQRIVPLSGNFAQLIHRRRQRALGSNHLGRRVVARRLGFLDVRDRDQPHVETLVGLIELTCDRLQRGLLRVQVVLGLQDDEVSLGHADHETLLGHVIVRLGLRDLGVGFPERHQVRVGKDAEAQIQAPALDSRIAGEPERHRQQASGDGIRNELGLIAVILLTRPRGRT